MPEFTIDDGDAQVAVIGMAARFGAATDLADYRRLRRGPGGIRTDQPLAEAHVFDAAFFGISPREAATLDPQQRILLECAHHALEDAGHAPGGDDAVIGVYAGGSNTSHAERLRDGELGPYLDDRMIRAATGADFLAARAAYRLGTTGPAVSVQCAGATALVAVHTAVQSLLGGECDLALAAAVTVRQPDDAEGATGGCAVVVLKLLQDALADRDRIHAVVRGTAVGTAGRGETEQRAHARIARDALAVSGVAADTVETIASPAATGVTDNAPGAAALVEAVLTVAGGESDGRPDEGPRRAGVSASGPFGTGAYVVVEEPPSSARHTPAASEEVWQLLPLAAKSAEAVEELAARLDHRLESTEGSLPDTAWTLQTGRAAYPHRGFVVGRDRTEVREALQAFCAQGHRKRTARREGLEVVFTFPGHGSQHLGMARGLYRQDPHFRADVGVCARLFEEEHRVDLREVLNPLGEEAEARATESLADGRIAQAALFTVEYALARSFQRWGIHPAAVVGHSLGAYAAACLAGVFALADAVRIVNLRGRLLTSIRTGAMAAVRLPEKELLGLLPDGVDIGVISGPEQVTITGPSRLVEQFVEEASADGIEVRLLRIPGAGHSSLVDPVLDDFEAGLAGIDFRAPSLPVISDTTGTWADPARISTPAYWRDHMRRTIRYHDVLDTLHGMPGSVLLEVGPGTTLSSLARRHADLRQSHEILQALPHPTDPTPDMKVLFSALGSLWSAGADIEWQALHPQCEPHKTGLPGYPYRRTEFPVPALR